MKITLRQKREIVRLFMLGFSVLGCAATVVMKPKPSVIADDAKAAVEFALRDYLNGAFKLRTAGKESR